LTLYVDRGYIAAMQEPTLLILTALAGTDRHGYGVISEVERLSGGRLRLSAGTLYRALDRLVGEGLVTGAGEEIVDGRLRRYYRLTDEGAGALGEEAERMRVQAETVLAELGKAGRRPAAAEPVEPPRAVKPVKPRTAKPRTAKPRTAKPRTAKPRPSAGPRLAFGEGGTR
jgi:DNA-binding PadR family transcriptional regulator